MQKILKILFFISSFVLLNYVVSVVDEGAFFLGRKSHWLPLQSVLHEERLMKFCKKKLLSWSFKYSFKVVIWVASTSKVVSFLILSYWNCCVFLFLIPVKVSWFGNHKAILVRDANQYCQHTRRKRAAQPWILVENIASFVLLKQVK